MSTHISESVARHIETIKPGSRRETRDGEQVLIVPDYDIDTDKARVFEMHIIKDAEAPKIKPGDTLHHTETGQPFDVVDLPSKLFGKVVKRDTPDAGAG